jgi:hypothetical protein
MSKTQIPPIAIDLDGGTDIGADIVDADLLLIDDGAGGTMRKTVASRLKTYIGGGNTVADQWRLTSAFTGNASPIASNLEQADTDGFGGIGSAMTQSSGVFTFPSTGVYLIECVFQQTLNGDTRYHHSGIETTTDNSSYDTAQSNTSFIQQTSSNTTYSMNSGSFIFDVTSTSTHKCRFVVSGCNASTSTSGDSTYNSTYFTFIRLGDT